MLVDILGKHPQIKVIDYMLSCPFQEFTKQQLAVGSEISRSTLDRFIDDFLEYGLLSKKDSKYIVNLKSAYIRHLNLMLDEVIKREIEIQENLPQEIGDELTVDDLNEIPDEVDLDKLEFQIESREFYTFSADKSVKNAFDFSLVR
jgi:hypothetical protein